jgi:hypothetical protein
MRKMEGMNQFRIQYIYPWKCHNGTLCIVVFNKKKNLFFPKKNGRNVKKILSGGWHQWERGRT